MTYQEKVEELLRYRKMADAAADLREELEELRSMAESCTAKWGGGGGGAAGTDKLARSVEKLTQKEAAIEAQEKQAAALREQLDEEIDTLQNIRGRRLLRLLYLGGLNQGQAADKLGYCRRLVNDLHRAAVKELLRQSGQSKDQAADEKRPVA